MAVIKGHEKHLKKPLKPSKVKISKEVKRQLSKRQDAQPVPAVAV